MTAVMLSACIVDYIQEPSRGRWVGTTSIFNGLGIVTMAGLLARLPTMYQDIGADNLRAGIYSFWTVAGLCLIVGLILFLGLYRKEKTGRESERPAAAVYAGHSHRLCEPAPCHSLWWCLYRAAVTSW